MILILILILFLLIHVIYDQSLIYPTLIHSMWIERTKKGCGTTTCTTSLPHSFSSTTTTTTTTTWCTGMTVSTCVQPPWLMRLEWRTKRLIGSINFATTTINWRPPRRTVRRFYIHHPNVLLTQVLKFSGYMSRGPDFFLKCPQILNFKTVFCLINCVVGCLFFDHPWIILLAHALDNRLDTDWESFKTTLSAESVVGLLV